MSGERARPAHLRRLERGLRDEAKVRGAALTSGGADEVSTSRLGRAQTLARDDPEDVLRLGVDSPSPRSSTGS